MEIPHPDPQPVNHEIQNLVADEVNGNEHRNLLIQRYFLE